MQCNHTHVWPIISTSHMSEHLQACKATGGSTFKSPVPSVVLTGHPDNLCGGGGGAETLLPFLRLLLEAEHVNHFTVQLSPLTR